MRRLAFLAALLLLTLPLLAQTERVSFVSGDGQVSFNHPAAWRVSSQADGYISLQTDSASISLIPPQTLALLDLDDFVDPARLADALVRERDLTPQSFIVFESGGRPAARIDYSGVQVPAGFFLAFPVLDDDLVAFDITPDDDRVDRADLQKDIEILVASLTYNPDAVPLEPYRTFITEDESLTFAYPRDWNITPSDDDSQLVISTTDARIAVLPPEVLALSGYDDITDPARLADAIISDLDYEPVRFRVFETNRRPAARYDYTGTTPDESGYFLVFLIDSNTLIAFDVVPLEPGANTDDLQKDLEILMTTVAYDTDGVEIAQVPTLAPAIVPTAAPNDAPASVTVAPTATTATTEEDIPDTPDATEDAAVTEEADAPDETEEPAATAEATSVAVLATATDRPAPTATATPDEAEGVTFTTEDGNFSLQHSRDWFIGQEDSSAIFGFLGDPAMSVTIYPPEALQELRYRMSAVPPEEFLDRYRAGLSGETGSIETLEINGLDAARRDVTLEAGGQFVTLQLPGGAFVVAEGVMFEGDFTEDAEDELLTLLESIDYSGDVVALDPDEDITARVRPLVNYTNPDPEIVMNQLRLQNLIPFGGLVAFSEDFAFYQGVGDNTFQFISRNASLNLVMAGELTYFPGNIEQPESCALTARLVSDLNGVQAQFDFGLTNEGLVFYRDDPFAEDAETVLETERLEGEITAPHHFVVILYDNRMTMYVDGLPVFDDVAVERREGLYALETLGATTETRCEGRDIWVYRLPESYEAGECIVSSTGPVNKREQPSVNSPRIGQLNAFTPQDVIAQTTGDDGFIWWRLDDNAWVRNDVVTAEGDCVVFFEGN